MPLAADMPNAMTGFTVFVIVSIVMVLLGWAYWVGYSFGLEHGRRVIVRDNWAYWLGFADGQKQLRRPR